MTKPRLLAAGILLTFGVTAAVAAQSRFEEGVFAELNRFRSDPAGYAEYLSDYRPRFEGKLLIGYDDGEIDIMTREGVAAVDEAIRDLRREKPLPTLEWSDPLARAAGRPPPSFGYSALVAARFGGGGGEPSRVCDISVTHIVRCTG